MCAAVDYIILQLFSAMKDNSMHAYLWLQTKMTSWSIEMSLHNAVIQSVNEYSEGQIVLLWVKHILRQLQLLCDSFTFFFFAKTIEIHLKGTLFFVLFNNFVHVFFLCISVNPLFFYFVDCEFLKRSPISLF